MRKFHVSTNLAWLGCVELILFGCTVDFPEKTMGDTESETLTENGTETGTGIDTSTETDTNTESDSDTGTATDSIVEECFVISEYLELGGDDRALELVNCRDNPIALEEYAVCLIADTDEDCTVVYPLAKSVLPYGKVITMCHPGLSAELFDVADCDYISDTLIAFDGDDRVQIIGPDGKLMDAFGRSSLVPPDAPWANMAYRRVDFAPYLDDEPFDVGTFFQTVTKDPFGHFGVSPF